MRDEGGFCSELAQEEVSWVEGEPSATSVLIFTVECVPSSINTIYTWILNKKTPCLRNGNLGRDRKVASHRIKRGFLICSKASSPVDNLAFIDFWKKSYRSVCFPWIQKHKTENISGYFLEESIASCNFSLSYFPSGYIRGVHQRYEKKSYRELILLEH